MDFTQIVGACEGKLRSSMSGSNSLSDDASNKIVGLEIEFVENNDEILSQRLKLTLRDKTVRVFHIVEFEKNNEAHAVVDDPIYAQSLKAYLRQGLLFLQENDDFFQLSFDIITYMEAAFEGFIILDGALPGLGLLRSQLRSSWEVEKTNLPSDQFSQIKQIYKLELDPAEHGVKSFSYIVFKDEVKQNVILQFPEKPTVKLSVLEKKFKKSETHLIAETGVEDQLEIQVAEYTMRLSIPHTDETYEIDFFEVIEAETGEVLRVFFVGRIYNIDFNVEIFPADINQN